MEEHPSAEWHSMGYVVVLIGVLGYVVSCFLPYGGVAYRPGSSSSLYRIFTQGDAALAAGGFLLLFAGATTVTLISFAALMRPGAWAFPALAAASIVWSMTSIGVLLGAQGFYSSMKFGYWLNIVSIAADVVGTVMVGVPVWARHSGRSSEIPIEEEAG
jgi:hypothetical protein